MSRSQDFCIRMPKECSFISKSKMDKWLIIEGIVFVLSLGGLSASLTGKLSQNHVIWFLELWKWCVLVMVILAGRRIMKWVMVLLVKSVKMVFLFMGVKVCYSYYIYSLGTCIGVALWFGSVLLTWVLLFKGSEAKRFLDLTNYVKSSHLDSHIQKYITRSLGTLVIGGFLWVLKTILVNLLSFPFQATRLFDRFRESLIDQYILEAFSKMLDESVVVNWINDNHLPCKKEEKILVIDRLKSIEPEEIFAWTMNGLIEVIKSPDPLSPITQKLEKLAKKEQDMAKLFKETKDVAKEIFTNVSGKSTTAENEITKDKLQSLFKADSDVKDVLQHINGAGLKEKDEIKAEKASDVNDAQQHINGTGLEEKDEVIGEQALRKWLVNATIERRSLVQSVNDTTVAIEELNKLLSVILLILLFVLWLIILGILSTQAFIAVMGQFVALAFIFGDTVKSVFQGIIFVFVKHPFDIGDSCLLNGEEVVVEKMNLLSTVFCKNVKEKIMYPNSVLTNQPIKNMDKGNYRHVISDSFEIAIDSSTITEPSQIESLQKAIRGFLRGRKDHWLMHHSFKFKEIEDKKLKIVLRVSYHRTVDPFESDRAMIIDRRHELLEELTNFFAKTEIKCFNILPKAVDAE